MSVSDELLRDLRRRANYACEYCGISETDSGAELTIDHFKPKSVGGGDDPDNLLYCCFRCNLYKADYWQGDASLPALWNPRQEPFSEHFHTLSNGALHPATPAGEFTIARLRLNRPALIEYRRRRIARNEDLKVLMHYEKTIGLLEQLQLHYAALLSEHRQLLDEQRKLLRLLLQHYHRSS